MATLTCYECGHRADALDGTQCPYCQSPDGMANLATKFWHRDQLDVFEMSEGHWMWAIGGQYPTGPFATRDEAREDAEATLTFELDEPASDLDAEWKADKVYRDAAYKTVRDGFEGEK